MSDVVHRGKEETTLEGLHEISLSSKFQLHLQGTCPQWRCGASRGCRVVSEVVSPFDGVDPNAVDPHHPASRDAHSRDGRAADLALGLVVA